MSEERAGYRVLNTQENSVTLSTEIDTLRAHLVDMERLLISMLATVQRAQGKEPSVMTRAERRRA